MSKLFKLTIVVYCIFCQSVSAQDPQFSQFYAAPLYLNPAFAGSSGMTRVGLNYRNQWPSLNANFVTYSAYADHFFEDINSGVGIIFLSDREGLVGLQSHSFGLQYAYHLRLTENITFRPGINVSATTKNINFNNLVFESQINPLTGYDPNLGSGEDGFNNNVFYVDFGVGGLFYSDQFWFGGSAYHLTEPNQSFADEGTASLPMKISIHAGYKIPINSANNTYAFGNIRDISVTPTAQYKMQGEFDQLDMGLYFTYEPLVLGLWYRGLPFKKLNNFANNESAIVLIGLTKNKFNIGYSFDYTLSQLGIASGGAHEISIRYEFFTGDPRRPPKSVRRIPCPRF